MELHLLIKGQRLIHEYICVLWAGYMQAPISGKAGNLNSLMGGLKGAEGGERMGWGFPAFPPPPPEPMVCVQPYNLPLFSLGKSSSDPGGGWVGILGGCLSRIYTKMLKMRRHEIFVPNF